MSNKAITPEIRYFDFSTIFNATKSFIDGYNKTNPQLTTRINSNHRATAELIVRLYAKQLNHAISLGTDISETLPGFKTFNPSLATCKGCTKRTIMNHKERLKAAGFIIKEMHRGKAGIELWINPLIFAPKKQLTMPSDNLCSKSENTGDLDLITKKILPLVHARQEQENNNSNVDKLITSEKQDRLSAPEPERVIAKIAKLEQGMNTQKSSTIHSSEQTRREKNKENQAQNLNHAPSENHSSTRKSSNSNPKSHSKRTKSTPVGGLESAFLLQLVTDFWAYAKAILYKDVILSAPEERGILNDIWVSVYKKFKIQESESGWTNYQNLLYNRIDMVAKYLERNPNRWVAPPHLYFDPQNTRNGFNKTYQWFLKQELLKKTIRNQVLLQTTEKEWQDHDKDKGIHKHKTRLQLFRIQQQRMGSYGDEQLMRSYQKSVQRYLKRPTLS